MRIGSRLSFLIIGFYLATPSSAVYADEDLKTNFARCAIISGDLERLACLDNLAEANGLQAPQLAPVKVTGNGKWNVMSDKNPIDDSIRVVASLKADSGHSRFKEPILLVARCQSNKTEVYVDWNSYLGDDSGSVYSSWKKVLVRVGSEKAQEQRWGISTDSKATFAPDWAGSLLKKMIENSSLIIQTVPYNENPITAVFDLSGAESALKPIADACGWELD